MEMDSELSGLTSLQLFAVVAGSSLPQPVLSIHRCAASPRQVPRPRAPVAPAEPQPKLEDLHQLLPIRRRQPPHRHPDHQPRHHERDPEMRLLGKLFDEGCPLWQCCLDNLTCGELEASCGGRGWRPGTACDFPPIVLALMS